MLVPGCGDDISNVFDPANPQHYKGSPPQKKDPKISETSLPIIKQPKAAKPNKYAGKRRFNRDFVTGARIGDKPTTTKSDSSSSPSSEKVKPKDSPKELTLPAIKAHHRSTRTVANENFSFLQEVETATDDEAARQQRLRVYHEVEQNMGTGQAKWETISKHIEQQKIRDATRRRGF